ncbi:GOLPH3/VPS74 family protein [Streptomyces varsoviensis]|uniref:GOLPH3/VPS74 family protein n=1 Tax=Streptomyces varsoviensis TaxID=67373 RepID=UPI000AE215D5|nr:GPP34 family phosphoprotein [Streptomyces varsoviensis]
MRGLIIEGETPAEASDVDPTLPQRMYLLSLYADDGEPGLGRYRGLLMRAAALTELTLDERLAEESGKALLKPVDEPPSDPFLAEVLRDVSPDEPRHWMTLLQNDAHTAEAAVREHLAEAGVITVRQGTALGVLPTRKITVNTPEEIRGLRERVRNAVMLGLDPATLPLTETATAVLAAEGEVESVFTLRERWRHRKALAALGDHFDGAVPGLRQAFRAAVASSRAAGGGWSQ